PNDAIRRSDTPAARVRLRAPIDKLTSFVKITSSARPGAYDEIQLLRLRSLLRSAAAVVLAFAQVAPGPECPAPGGRLLLLRVLESQIPLAAHPFDSRRLHVRLVAGPGRMPAKPAPHPRAEHGA